MLLTTVNDDHNDDHDEAHFYLFATVFVCTSLFCIHSFICIHLKISLLCHHLNSCPFCPLNSCVHHFNKAQICRRKKVIFGLIFEDDSTFCLDIEWKNNNADIEDAKIIIGMLFDTSILRILLKLWSTPKTSCFINGLNTFWMNDEGFMNFYLQFVSYPTLPFNA